MWNPMDPPQDALPSGLGKRFAQYAVVDGEFATAPFLHTVGDLGLWVVARLKDNLPELFTAAGSAFLADLPPPSFPTGKIAWRSGRPTTSIPGIPCAGQPCGCSSIASTSRMARWSKPTG